MPVRRPGGLLLPLDTRHSGSAESDDAAIRRPGTDTGAPRDQAGRRRRLRRFGAAIGAVAAAVIGVEVVVRIAGIGPPDCRPRRTVPDEGVPYWRDAAGLLLYRPGATFAHVYDAACVAGDYLRPDGRIDYRINDLGFRGPPVAPEKPPGVFRILCLGDSFTFGEGVREADTYASLLPAMMAAEVAAATAGRLDATSSPTGAATQPVSLEYESINAGVQGHGTVDEVALYLRYGRRLRPDAVVLQFFLNDATESIETIRQHEARLAPAELSAAARVSRIWEIVELGRMERSRQDLYFRTTRRSFHTDNWAACRRALAELSEATRADGARLLVVIFPMLYSLDGAYPFEDLHRLISAAATEAGCATLDLLTVYRGRDARELWVHPTDAHPNATAHRLAAEAIARRLASP